MDVGNSIRHARKKAGLSQQELAKLSNISTNTLSLLERGLTSPTIATLQKLADTLNVELSSFFLFSKLEQHVSFSKSNRRNPIHTTEGYIYDLIPGFVLSSFKPLKISINPGGISKKAVKHPGFEFLYCLDNELLVMVSDLIYLLEKGDSIFFNASLPHHWQNNTDTVTSILMIQLKTDEDGEEQTEQFHNPYESDNPHNIQK